MRVALGCCLLVLLLGACRQSAQATAVADLHISLDQGGAAPMIGKTTLIVLVTDAGGLPVNDAKVSVVGDMTHGGMMPSQGSADKGDGGRYAVPFAWTMGGDWVLTVTATLPDGRKAVKPFKFTLKDG